MCLLLRGPQERQGISAAQGHRPAFFNEEGHALQKVLGLCEPQHLPLSPGDKGSNVSSTCDGLGTVGDFLWIVSFHLHIYSEGSRMVLTI